ncbi:MAG: M4 family metallopeptidase [Planctomycetia bacterium]|nr:MAG: M4 family metallopeptidase [Planctomycetia bacterium]
MPRRRSGRAWPAAALIVAAVACPCAFSADRSAPLFVQRSGDTAKVQFVRAADGGPLVAQTAANEQGPDSAFWKQVGPAYGIRDAARELRLRRAEVDSLGWTHYTYEQVYAGVPVFSGVLRVHRDPGGDYRRVTGHFRPIPDKLDPAPKLTVEAAQAVYQKQERVGSVAFRAGELTVVDPGWYGDPHFGPRLAWRLIATDTVSGLSMGAFVDAHSGELLDQWALDCTLLSRQIRTGSGTSLLPGTMVRQEGEPPSGDVDVDRAYDYAADTYHYLNRAFGRDSLDGAGMALVATVHSTAPGCPNALWNDSLQAAILCPNTCSDDVVAHEFIHGLTQYTANLIYQNQSGQINESMSDIFGELVDLFNGDAAFPGEPTEHLWPDVSPSGPGRDTPNTLRATGCSSAPGYVNGVRWLIGEDATGFTAGLVRDMWQPTCRNHPDRNLSALQTCPLLDAGGVHIGSGVMNHAFAMATDGKTFNGYTVIGIGPIKTGAIWYRALTVYLTPASDYGDAYQALLMAADDLVGSYPADPRTGLPSAAMLTADDRLQLQRALLAVEMDQLGNCGWTDDVAEPTPGPICASRIVVLADSFESGPGDWTVWNSGPTTPYDWVQVNGSLPSGRPGTAWYIHNSVLGSCSGVGSEAGIHSLFSPVVVLPAGGVPMAAFQHFMAVEGGWDGGNLKVRVDGGEWQTLPRRAFLHGPYNGRLRTVAQSNTNPLAGETAFIGAGGRWGYSIVDLGALAVSGQSVQIRFDFSKDCAFGFDGWYIDDFELYLCPDCNLDGVADVRDANFADASEPLCNFGWGAPQSWTTTTPPLPASGPVTITVHGVADFSSQNEYADVSLNGVGLGQVFRAGGADCPNTPDAQSIIVPAATFNALTGVGVCTIGLTGSINVDPLISNCRGATCVQVAIRYPTVLAACPPSTRIYVKQGATGANNGTSWASAYARLQDALVAAQCCNTEIWVAAGSYRPSDVGDRGASFRLRSGVRVYGGFVGTETALAQRNPVANLTVLDGDLLGDDEPDFVHREDNAYHVVRSLGANGLAVLDGFTIRGGNADGALAELRGGGLLVEGGGPTIRDCVFVENSGCGGAAIHAQNAMLEVETCTILANFAHCSTAGAVSLHGGSVTLRDSTLSFNEADGDGGAAVVSAGVLRLERCHLHGNRAARGGGVHVASGAELAIVGGALRDNRAVVEGGAALHVAGGTVEAHGVMLAGNVAESPASAVGGAALWLESGGARIVSSVFNANRAFSVTSGAGGAVRVDSGVLELIHPTLVGNSADGGDAGALSALGGSIVIRNAIVTQNGPDPLVAAGAETTLSVARSIVEGGFAGDFILDADPRFADRLGTDLVAGTSDDDLRLLGDSPAIDAADNAALAGDPLDVDGDSDTSEAAPFDAGGALRFVDDCGTMDSGVGDPPLADLGAYEYAGSALPEIILHPLAQAVCAGSPVTLTVAAESAAPLTYRWRRAGEPLIEGAEYSGVGSAQLVIGSAGVALGGAFDVEVENGCGTVTSEAALLTVAEPIEISQHPANVYACDGQPASFSVTGTFGPGATFQWRRDAEALADGPLLVGAQTPTLELLAVGMADAGAYRVEITNACGSVTSDPATLGVGIAAGVIGAIEPGVVCAGGIGTLVVTATGDPAPTIEWRRGGEPLSEGAPYSGVSTAALTVDPFDITTAGEYSVVVSNSCGAAEATGTLSLVLLGDANCDGAVNNFDIDYFVQGVLSPDAPTAPAGYLTAGGTQNCWSLRHCWGDLDDSGSINNFDIDPFVACVLAPPPLGMPCP